MRLAAQTDKQIVSFDELQPLVSYLLIFQMLEVL